MNSILQDFYSGQLFSKYDLEAELEKWNDIVKEYEDSNVYQGDSYYQDALGTQGALQEAMDNYHLYYDENENYIYQ